MYGFTNRNSPLPNQSDKTNHVSRVSWFDIPKPNFNFLALLNEELRWKNRKFKVVIPILGHVAFGKNTGYEMFLIF